MRHIPGPEARATILRARVTCLRLIAAACWAASLPALAGEPTADMLKSAGIIARVEGPLAKGDLGAYCNAMYASPDYLDYLERACQSAVRNRLRRPEECTPQAVLDASRKDVAKCAAMTRSEFDAAKEKWRRAHESFVQGTAATGVDGEKLIEEARDRQN